MWHFGKSVKKTLSEIIKKETASRWVDALRQLLIIFGGAALVQLAMRNWSGKNGSVCWTTFRVFTLGKTTNYFTSENTENWTKSRNGSKPIHYHWFTINVVEIKTILADIKYLSKFCQVGNLGILHSVLNKYCPKRLHFTLEGLIARTQLAVLDYNCGSNNTQATTKKGKRRYK